MPKFLTFVFKVLFGTLLISIFTTFFVSIFDAFLTINRVQNLAEVVQMDIAENNCMLYSMYDSYGSQLNDILDRSALHGYRLITSADRLDSSAKAFDVVKKGGTATHSYMQTVSGSTGGLEGATTSTPAFYVANYGEILEFKTNLAVQMQFMFFVPAMDTQDGTSVKDFGYFWFPVMPFTLSYEVPALTYLK